MCGNSVDLGKHMADFWGSLKQCWDQASISHVTSRSSPYSISSAWVTVVRDF